MNSSVLINVDNITRFYGTTCAVKQISFQVQRGEVLGFLGPNGAGKSTTMLMLTGNLAPSSGEIIINGHNLRTKPKSAKRYLGFLPEHPPLYREFTVEEYLRICAKLNRVTPPQLTRSLDSVMERCGLTQVRKRLIGVLSKGMQQRAGIAQAIIHNPPVVILDEPTVGLDPIQIREIRQLIRELAGEHSVILSSHILPEIQSTCDRVQIIHRGELVLTDSVKNLEHHLRESSLIVGLKNPPQASELQNIQGVIEVESLDAHRFKINFDPNQDPAEAIATKASQQQWRLFELSPEKRSIEQLFVDIITSEPAAESANTDSQEQVA